MLLTSANLYFIFLCLTEEMCKCYMNFMFIKFWALVWETGAPMCLATMNHLGSTWYQQLEQRGVFPLVENKESAKGRRAFDFWVGIKATWTLSISDLFLTLGMLIMLKVGVQGPAEKKNVSFSLSLILSLYLKPHSAHFISAVLHYFCIRPFSLCLLTCYYITQGHTGCTGIHH